MFGKKTQYLFICLCTQQFERFLFCFWFYLFFSKFGGQLDPVYFNTSVATAKETPSLLLPPGGWNDKYAFFHPCCLSYTVTMRHFRRQFSLPSPSPHLWRGGPNCCRSLVYQPYSDVAGLGHIQTLVLGGQLHATKARYFNRVPLRCHNLRFAI